MFFFKALKHLILSELNQAALFAKSQGYQNDFHLLDLLAQNLSFKEAPKGEGIAFIGCEKNSQKKFELLIPLNQFQFYRHGKENIFSNEDFSQVVNKKEAKKIIQKIIHELKGITLSSDLVDYLEGKESPQKKSEESMVKRIWPYLLILISISLFGLWFQGADRIFFITQPLALLFTFFTCYQLIKNPQRALVFSLPVVFGGGIDSLVFIATIFLLLYWEEKNYNFKIGVVVGFLQLFPPVIRIEGGVVYLAGLFIFFGFLKFLYPRFTLLKSTSLVAGIGLGLISWFFFSSFFPQFSMRVLPPTTSPILFGLVMGSSIILCLVGWFVGVHHKPLHSFILIPAIIWMGVIRGDLFSFIPLLFVSMERFLIPLLDKKGKLGRLKT